LAFPAKGDRANDTPADARRQERDGGLSGAVFPSSVKIPGADDRFGHSKRGIRSQAGGTCKAVAVLMRLMIERVAGSGLDVRSKSYESTPNFATAFPITPMNSDYLTSATGKLMWYTTDLKILLY